MNKNRAGYYRTNLTGEAAYQSFVPSPLPPVPPVLSDNEMIALLVQANKQIAALNEIAKRIPSVALFVSMYVRKEALMSSQIEGTQATLEDVFDPLIETNTNRNVADVVNYIKATEYAVNRLPWGGLRRLLHSDGTRRSVPAGEDYPGGFGMHFLQCRRKK